MPQGASAPDMKSLPEAVDTREKKQLLPEEMSADQGCGGDANFPKCAEKGVNLIPDPARSGAAKRESRTFRM